MITNRDYETMQQARREYHREWRRANPEKVMAAQQRFWLRKAAQMGIDGRSEKEPEGHDDDH